MVYLKKNLFLFFVVILLSFCTTKNVNETEEKNLIANAIDSFSINNFQSDLEIEGVTYINDSILMSFDGFNRLNMYHRRKNNSFFYFKSATLKPQTENSRFFYTDGKKDFYLFESHRLHKYDSSFNLIKTLPFNFQTKYLKNNYRPTLTPSSLLLKTNNSFICNFSHEDASQLFDSYKEPSKLQFTLYNDSIVDVNCFFKKPQQLKHYDGDFPYSHVLINNKIYQLYGSTDSIYIYDLNTKTEFTKPIKNKDYSLPIKLDLNRLLNGDFKYQKNHFLTNFYYNSLFYDEKSKHFFLFYTLPKKNIIDKNQTDKISKVIVLNEKLEVIKYFLLKNKYVPYCGFIIKGRGFAMPLFHKDLTDEKTTYHIFNF